MTGEEFKKIRKFNKISQEQVCDSVCLLMTRALNKQADRFHRTVITDIEQESYVPPRFVIALSNLIGLDLTKKDVLEEHLKEIPKDFGKKVLIVDYFSRTDDENF